MKTSQVLVLFLAVIGMNSLVGCSAKIDGGVVDLMDKLAPPPSSNGSLQVEGIWETDCLQDTGAAYKAKYVFSGNRMDADVVFYSDAQCTSKFAEEHASGVFAISGPSQDQAGAFNLDYTITTDNGVTETLYDLVMVENNSLYLAEYQGMNPQSRPIEVSKKIAYKKK